MPTISSSIPSSLPPHGDADDRRRLTSSSNDTVDSLTMHSFISQLNQVIAGAISGCLTRTLTQPFDVLKIRFQLQVEPISEKTTRTPTASSISTTTSPSKSAVRPKYTSLLQACRSIYREEGILAFWKGHNSGQVMSMLYTIAQFWSYEQIKLSLQQTGWFRDHANATNFVSGGCAGCIATVLGTPFDVIRTRVVAQDRGVGYNSMFTAFPTIIRNEGVRGLYRGLTISLIQIAPMVGCNFMFYKYLNKFTENILESPNGQIPMGFLLVNGAAAGIASKTVIYPLDFIKKRLQLQGFEMQRQTFGRNQRCTNMRDCIKLTVREEGIMGFYKGIIPTLLKSGSTTALYFAIYDMSKAFLNR